MSTTLSRYFLGLCILLSFISGKAQNLVQNNSFENINANCSGFTGAGYVNLFNWYNPDPTDSCSTPDWFATCLPAIFPTKAPNSQLGNQNPRTGQAYGGFIGYDASSSGYREYVEGEFSTPLTAGVNYCVTFYVSLADNCPYAINQMGVYFTNTLCQFPVSHCNSTVPLPYTPQLQWTGGTLSDKTNWVKMQWQYTATGGEKYFTIGNFKTNANTTVTNVGASGLPQPFAYYFIDDVSVVPGPCCNSDITPVGPFCLSASSVNLVGETAGGVWSGPGITNSSTGTFNPATAGTGTHVVTYSIACGSSTTAIVVNACNLTVCATGSVLTASGGTGPYNWETGATNPTSGGGYSWSTYASNTPTVNSPSTYPIRVTNSAGETYSMTSLASIPACTTTSCPTLTLSVSSQTNVNCFGASTGSASISTTGGTAGYTYTWSPGNLNGASQTGLAAGIYNITIRDGANCPGTGTVNITQPSAALGATVATSPATCGSSNGSASVTVSGGTSGYTYSWSPSGGTGTTASSLSAGTYSVLVTDSKGCTRTASGTISSAGGPSVSVVSSASVNCFGASTGSATVNATGGSGPYTYTWTPGNLNGASQTGLAAGTYSIAAADAGGCIGSTTVAIAQPSAAVTAVISGTTATTCGNSVGAATVTAGGGTPGYTYNWSPSGGSGSTASGLAGGSYTATVTDSKGCTQTAVATISSAGGPTLSVSSQTNVTCAGGNNGAATVSATGGSGSYTYTWSPSGGNSSSASGLSAGNYTITVKDASNCSNTAVVTITQGPAISVSVTTTQASCGSSDGSATVNATGGTGALTYTWSTGANTSSISSLAPGAYTVNVTDAQGCTASGTGVVSVSGTTLTVDAGLPAGIKSGESTVLDGTIPSGLTFTWSPSGSLSCSNCENPVASPTITTTYTLAASNSGGCIVYDTVTVFVEMPCGDLYVPTAFSPNGDGQNDVLFVMGACVVELEFAIFDRWGEKVFETTDPSIGWDGTYKGKKLDPAVFAYYLTATVNNEPVKKNGSITIVK